MKNLFPSFRGWHGQLAAWGEAIGCVWPGRLSVCVAQEAFDPPQGLLSLRDPDTFPGNAKTIVIINAEKCRGHPLPVL